MVLLDEKKGLMESTLQGKREERGPFLPVAKGREKSLGCGVSVHLLFQEVPSPSRLKEKEIGDFFPSSCGGGGRFWAKPNPLRGSSKATGGGCFCSERLFFFLLGVRVF